MFILKKGHQPGVYVPLRALFLVHVIFTDDIRKAYKKLALQYHPVFLSVCRSVCL